MWNHRVIITVCAVLVASTAPAQLPDKTPVELYTACIATAIDSGEVSLETGAFIRFVCHGDVARFFFRSSKPTTTARGKQPLRETRFERSSSTIPMRAGKNSRTPTGPRRPTIAAN